MKNFYDNFEDYPQAYCSAWVATAIVGSAVVGGAVQAYSANKAAQAQKEAANIASQTQLTAADRSNQLIREQYNQTRADLGPYRDVGQTGIDQLNPRLKDLTTPFSTDKMEALTGQTQIDQATLDLAAKTGIPAETIAQIGITNLPPEMLALRDPLKIDQATLETLPGYQFALQQGTKAAQNSAAARGLGVSGAALKGASTFAKGLADQSFANYFGTEMANREAAFGRYLNTAQAQEAMKTGSFGRGITASMTEDQLKQAAFARGMSVAQLQEALKQGAFGREDVVLGRNIQQQGNAFDRLKGLIDTGSTAAARTAALGTDVAKTSGANITGAGNAVAANTIGAGNAQAAATNATGNALAGAVNTAGAGYAGYNMGLYTPPSSRYPNMTFTQGTAGSQYVPTYG
jgi:hypothetical protein